MVFAALPPIFRSRLFRYGLPFMVTVVGGSFWLRDFAQLRYTFRKVKRVSAEEFAELVGKQKDLRRVDPEELLREVQAEADANYEMVRGPRPWEENNQLEEIKKKRQEERKRKKEAAAAAVV
ncbi:cytochrome c oxidase assembly protein COX16 homolog, mitochondrial-like [Paramacrobiotus metropolitanus]|uniref:cytochrome c oxidase assembly protein COX16 homolog, mitochondrial-like n=1 Tax=Paramacrobiotus metropolitanus TaxID=2943436 RepID=UPI0024458A48|nr:cytochrome c oxidase assembly protein COX16 homolog, mitochondrial-like [Paramacrobiotus metropolitanus]